MIIICTFPVYNNNYKSLNVLFKAIQAKYQTQQKARILILVDDNNYLLVQIYI